MVSKKSSASIKARRVRSFWYPAPTTISLAKFGISQQTYKGLAMPLSINILLILRFCFTGDSLCTVESYDPSTGKWQKAQPMSMLRSRLGVAVLHGKLYACGGYNGTERLSTVEVLDPLRKIWHKVSPMHCKRSALGATALGKVIYVCGGYDGITSLSSVEKYCPLTNRWTMVAPMNKSRSAGAVVAFQGT